MTAKPPSAPEELVPGALNFRAVPGYRAGHGRIRVGALYRSGAMDGMPDAGFAKLRQIGVTTAFDLRSNREKIRRPSPLVQDPGFHVASFAHDC